VIDSEERGVASLDERLAAARRAADAGYGIGFHFDPIIVSGSIEETVGRYREVAERILDEVPLHRVSWVSLGLLRYPPSLPNVALKRFPDTTIFTGELVPVGRKVRYHRFMRGKVLGPLWETLAAKIPRHKLYLCMETPAVWRSVDESVHSSACIAGRLCNTEPIGGCF